MHNKVASCIMHVCMYAAEHWLIQLSPTLALWQSNGHLPCNSRCNSNINIGQRLCIYGALHHWTHCKQQWKETSRQTEALVKTLLLMVYERDRIKSMLMKLWRKRSARVYNIQCWQIMTRSKPTQKWLITLPYTQTEMELACHTFYIHNTYKKIIIIESPPKWTKLLFFWAVYEEEEQHFIWLLIQSKTPQTSYWEWAMPRPFTLPLPHITLNLDPISCSYSCVLNTYSTYWP